MLQSEFEGSAPWGHLPEADPPPRLRAAVLADWEQARGRRSGRMAGVAAGFAVAALFVMAVTLPMRMRGPNAVDPAALALLRSQGIDVVASAATSIPEVRRVASGSTAARLGLRPGDRLLHIDLPAEPDGMMNVSVLRGDSSEYFALPGFATGAGGPDAGMAASPNGSNPVAPPVAVATQVSGPTSLPQSPI